MGGVDRGDQLRSYHNTNRKSNSWWHQILFYLVDIARVNAYICYKHHNEGANDALLPHCYFTMEIAEGLINGYANGSKDRQFRGKQISVVNFNGLHTLDHMGHDWPRVCKMCSMEGKKTANGCRVKTVFGCGGQA